MGEHVDRLATVTRRFPNDIDIIDLAKHMRQADIDELKTVCDFSPDEAVIKSLQASDPQFLRAYHADQRLICIAGCSPQSPNTAQPWLLATDLLDKYAKCLTKEARIGTRAMLARYGTLSNVVDARNSSTINWLQAIGFSMYETLEIKPGFPVLRFEMRAANE